MNTHSQLTLARLRRAKQNRFNPLSSVTDPTQVARKIDSFEADYLKDVVNIFDALEQRKDLIRAVVSKRKKAVWREGWTVLIQDNVDKSQHSEAERHATALEHFYQSLRCENALDRAEKGLARQGSSQLAVPTSKLLCRQMMDAIGKRLTATRFVKPVVQTSAVHEIVWEVGPRPPGAHSACADSSALSPSRAATRSPRCPAASLLMENEKCSLLNLSSPSEGRGHR